jgi:alcohol dehydrogenase class IV
MSIAIFSFPTPIHFGPGARHETPAYLKKNGSARPLVLTDRDVAKLPIYEAFLADLKTSGLQGASFAEIFGNPVKSQVIAGVQAFQSHRADSIVAFGGGATLDVAKAVALMVNHPGDLFDYEDGKSDARPIDKEIPLWIGIPTTAGTGSEVGRSTVISDDQTHVKKIIFSPKLLARAVFADPELTIALPAKVTAATGMDALTHCVESYLAKDYHPICDGIALEGLSLVARNLKKCVDTPNDLNARGAMLMAAIMGAVAFQKGLGLVHSCAHSLSTVANLHHGLANGIMIDHALPFNLPTVPDKFERMAVAVGVLKPSSDKFLPWLRQLKASINIPEKLSEVGIKKDQIEKLADTAIQDVCHQNNPRPVTRDDFRKIFTQAL